MPARGAAAAAAPRVLPAPRALRGTSPAGRPPAWRPPPLLRPLVRRWTRRRQAQLRGCRRWKPVRPRVPRMSRPREPRLQPALPGLPAQWVPPAPLQRAPPHPRAAVPGRQLTEATSAPACRCRPPWPPPRRSCEPVRAAPHARFPPPPASADAPPPERCRGRLGWPLPNCRRPPPEYQTSATAALQRTRPQMRRTPPAAAPAGAAGSGACVRPRTCEAHAGAPRPPTVAPALSCAKPVWPSPGHPLRVEPLHWLGLPPLS
mmetsp:Transcript_31787/g.99219  ORF Transcript_31787/g.99219 Transcript_31787/m.99219 type:complete len:261 (+) Transcript_31787:183-965(+)